MIPDHIRLAGSFWHVLPSGIHYATLAEVEARFASNPRRRVQFKGFVAALTNLRAAGCRRAFLDGSFVTTKPRPGDFDACWDPEGVDFTLLDPVILNLHGSRMAQKVKYHGELFPYMNVADQAGTFFIDFFQVVRGTGDRKGIVAIDLRTEPML